MTSLSTTPMSRPLRLNAVGLIIAAAGIMLQYVSGVEGYPTIPPGPIILLAAALIVARGPRRWAPAVGLGAALFVSIGGVVATIAGNGFRTTLGDPGEVGGFIGAFVQIAGLLLADAAGVAAVRRRRSTQLSQLPT